MGNDEGPLRRVLAGPAGRAVDTLAGLSGADLVTAHLEVARRRAARSRGPDVLRRHRDDRCFKVLADFGDGLVEVGDGGFTTWTRRLLGNAKERLMTSGLGVDRLAGLVSAAAGLR